MPSIITYSKLYGVLYSKLYSKIYGALLEDTLCLLRW